MHRPQLKATAIERGLRPRTVPVRRPAALSLPRVPVTFDGGSIQWLVKIDHWQNNGSWS